MLENGYIEPAQFRKLVMFFILGRAILILPTLLTGAAQQDAWISEALGLMFGIFMVLLFRKLGSLYPKMTLVGYSRELLGPWAGRGVAFLFFIHAFILSSLLTRSLGIFMASTIMPETPIQWTMGLFLFIAAVGVRKGLENIGRTADIFFPVVIFLFIVFVVFVIPQIETDKLQPVMAKGFVPVLRGAYIAAGFPYMNLVLMLMIFPFVIGTRDAGKAFMHGTLLGGIALTILTLLCILVLGSKETSDDLFAAYELAKTIQIGMFIQRVEAIMALVWFITIYFQLVICIYAAVSIFAETFQSADQRTLVFPMAFLLTAAAQLVAPNISFLAQFYKYSFSMYTFTFGLLTIILLGAGIVRQRRR